MLNELRLWLLMRPGYIFLCMARPRLTMLGMKICVHVAVTDDANDTARLCSSLDRPFLKTSKKKMRGWLSRRHLGKGTALQFRVGIVGNGGC